MTSKPCRIFDNEYLARRESVELNIDDLAVLCYFLDLLCIFYSLTLVFDRQLPVNCTILLFSYSILLRIYTTLNQ